MIMAAATTSKIKQKTRFRWDQHSEEILLQLWEDKMPQFRSSRRSGHIYNEIAAELQDMGFVLHAAEVKIKIHNMTNKYRQEKKKTGPSGESPSTWMWFDRIHSILGSLKSFNLEALIEESSVSLDVELESDNAEYINCGVDFTPDLHSPLLQSQDINEDSSCCEPERKRSKLSGFQQILIDEIKECNKAVKDGLEAIKESDKEALQIQKELLKLTLAAGIYTGIYISQNYEVPRVDEPSKIIDKIKEYADEHRKK